MSAGVVIFDAAAFVQRYPQFAAVPADTLGMLFDEATLIVNNTPNSVVRDVAQRRILLNLVVAHIATLSGVASPGGEGSNATQVGRVSSATEGSVSASLEMGATSNASAYWLQTQYGATYWQLTAKFRTMRYIPPRSCRGYRGR